MNENNVSRTHWPPTEYELPDSIEGIEVVRPARIPVADTSRAATLARLRSIEGVRFASNLSEAAPIAPLTSWPRPEHWELEDQF